MRKPVAEICRRALALLLVLTVVVGFLAPGAGKAYASVPDGDVSETEAPVEDPTEDPAEDPTEEPTDDLTEDPAEELPEEAAEDPTEEPTEEPSDEPVEIVPTSFAGQQPMTVRDVIEAMDAGQSFAVLFGFDACPSCQIAHPILAAVAAEYGQSYGYVDTRANPDWTSNMDIDDYDLLVARFGDFIPLDENGLKHLYVPHVFFIRDGEVVFEYQGLGGADPETVTAEQQTELAEIYRTAFDLINGSPDGDEYREEQPCDDCGGSRSVNRGSFAAPTSLPATEDEILSVPNAAKGSMQSVTYGSWSGLDYSARVYLPAGYDSTKPYNVLYLFPGVGGTEASWLDEVHNRLTGKNLLDWLFWEGGGNQNPFIVVTTRQLGGGGNDPEAQIDALMAKIDTMYSSYSNEIFADCVCAQIQSRHVAFLGASLGADMLAGILIYSATGVDLADYWGLASTATNLSDELAAQMIDNINASDGRLGLVYITTEDEAHDVEGHPFYAAAARMNRVLSGASGNVDADNVVFVEIPAGHEWASYNHFTALSGFVLNIFNDDCPCPQSGTAFVQKASANAALSVGSGYSLAGAEYKIYGSRADALANRNPIATLTTNAEGKSNTVELDEGGYWAKETKAPKGFALNPNPIEFTVNKGETTKISATDAPKSDPVGVLLQKRPVDLDGRATRG